MSVGVGASSTAGELGARSSRGVALAKRVGSGVVLIPFFILLNYAGLWTFAAFVVLVGGVAQWEYTRMFTRAGVEVHRRIGLLAGLAVTASFAWPAWPDVSLLVLTLTVVGLLSAELWSGRSREPRWAPSAVTLFGVLYVNWLLGHAVWLRALPHGMEWIFFLAWVTWVGESTAYFVGSAFGRHKLAPPLSPTKTVEGALAQLCVSPIAALAGYWWFFPESALIDAVSLGLLLGIAGQVGDLAESFLKRSCHTKDTGALIPGHGGLLDRVDSLLFNAPVLFYYAGWIAAV
ncbi:MAG: phosphatidate cytidylyltransferase [Candidatus Methylomirabilia bacterium]